MIWFEMISIIIPVYNAIDTIEETINSAINSGVVGQEIILVDDCSSDGSLKILEKYEKNYSFISILKNSKNLGGGAARNLGISYAKNEYIFVLDSDDVLVTNALPKALEEMLSRNLDGIANGFASCFVDDINKPTFTYQFTPGPIFFEALLDAKPNPVIGNLLFKKNTYLDVGGYPEYHGFDTQSFGFRLLSNRKIIYVCDFQMYHQRLPKKPSYYIREMKAGNLNKNWFFIFFEHLYKFNAATRIWILNYSVHDPFLLAKGQNMFTELINNTASRNIFCTHGVKLSDAEAYEEYISSSDELLRAWCLVYDINRGNLKNVLYGINQIECHKLKEVLIFTWLAKGLNFKLAPSSIERFQYFFNVRKSLAWTLKFYMQKVLNRVGKTIGK